MVEAKEMPFVPEDQHDVEKVSDEKPDLTLITENESSLVEHQRELDMLAKFQRDFGLADQAKAIRALVPHMDQRAKAVKYVELNLAQQIYTSAVSQLEGAKPAQNRLEICDVKDFARGAEQAIAEDGEPGIPELKAAYLQESQKDEAGRQIIRDAYLNFYKKMTGEDASQIEQAYEDAMHRIRNISVALSPEAAKIQDRRAKLEKELIKLSTTRSVETNYDGIKLPNPTGFYHSQVELELNKDSQNEISATEFNARLKSLMDEVDELEQQSQFIRADSSFTRRKERVIKKEPGILQEIAGLFKRKKR